MPTTKQTRAGLAPESPENYRRCAAALGSDLCPECKGVPAHPEVEGSKGCGACDYTGTLAGHKSMQALEAEMWEQCAKDYEDHKAYIARGVCSQCGACNRDEAGDKCTASSDETGEYSCAGDDLWPDDQNT
jgi:hypothetical protein